MNNLKDELERIDIPTELRARAKQGIEQAAKEHEFENKAPVQPSKKHKLLVGAFTTAVTAAAALFIVAVVNPDLFVWNTANGAETAKLWYSKWLIIPVLSVLLNVLLYGTFKLIRKFPNYKGLTIFGSLIGVYCLGVGIWYSAQMLQERVILPLEMEFIKGQEEASLFVGYLVDRFDEKTDIEALIIDGHKIESEDYIKQYLKVGETIQRINFNLNYAYKRAYFELSKAQLDTIILGGADLSKSDVLFLDGTTVPIDIRRFDYAKDTQGNYIDKVDLQPWDSSGGPSVVYILNGETRIHKIDFPQHPKITQSYELKLDDRVIKRVNFMDEEDIDLLPVDATSAKQLELTVFEIDWDEQLLQFDLPVFIFGEQKIYFDRISKWEQRKFNGLMLDKEY